MLDSESLADIVTIGDVTRHHARIRPDRVAIHFEGQRTTYGQLDRRANRVANGLIAESVGPQARIGRDGFEALRRDLKCIRCGTQPG